MKKITLITLVIGLIFSVCLFAEDGLGGQAGAFLRIPVGARPSGLGNAFVAIADNANAAFWNPGGLYQIETTTLGAMYSMMTMDRHHYAGSFIYPYNSGTFSIMWNNFGVSDIDGRDIDGNPTSLFSDNETSISFGYCYYLPAEIGIGANFKYLIHSIAENNATGIGFDFGIHKKITNLRIGASVSNLGAKMKWDTDSSLEEEIPTTVRAGAACEFEHLPVLICAEISKNANEDPVYHFGSEVTLLKALILRGGFNKGDVNFGASIKLTKYQIDYAYCPDVLNEGITSKFGLQISF